MADHMKFLSYVANYEDENKQKVFERKLKRAENRMKEQRTEALKAEYLKKTQERTKQLQDNLIKRMNKVVKKIGKPDM